jgi:hypothetical protein
MLSSTPRRIVFCCLRRVALLDLSGPLEAFRIASEFALKGHYKAYECVIVSSLGGRVRTASGVDLNTKSVRSLAEKPIDTLLIPGAFFVEDVTRDRALIQWFRVPVESHSFSTFTRAILMGYMSLLTTIGTRHITHKSGPLLHRNPVPQSRRAIFWVAGRQEISLRYARNNRLLAANLST